MAKTVYFAPFMARTSKIKVLSEVLRAVDVKPGVRGGKLTAVKLHFGEKGNDTYIRPVFIRAVVDEIKRCGGKPFLTDSNTLYAGSRKNSVDHLITAVENGFDYAVTGAPLIIADGLMSNDYRTVKIQGDFFKNVKISSAIADAEALVVVSHFKGHVAAGYGGAIKNLAMGCAPAVGKKEQHAVHLEADLEKCIGCGKCFRNCPAKAISMSGGKSYIDGKVCIGCCECMTVCPTGAVSMVWQGENDRADFNRRMAEYAYGTVKGRRRVVYINIMADITPLCDCCGWSDSVIVPDIGIAASTDPVALDKACYDMVTAASGLPCGEHRLKPGDDKFKLLHPATEPMAQMEHAEKMGLGSMNYELEKVVISSDSI